MKKLIALLLLLALVLVSAGCGSTPAQATPAPTPAPTEAPAATPAPTEAPEAVPEIVKTEATPAEPAQENKSLVVVFSCTGTTKGVAEKIAALIGAELVDLAPAQPYTAEDLNYNDRSTRATVEQNNPDARPEIAEDISLDGVATLYLGYPIWWGQAPRIMSTFVESHDFTGITVVPFCTSGGSGAGRTGETLGEQAGTGTFLTSTRFSSGVSDSELQSWIDSYK
ncbi:MAG: flavodoxin [Oscillospiraceae bacterium]|nr:flavodoxin [Oscillospiraceae bacterium]